MLEGIQKMIDEAIEVLYIKYVTGTLHENFNDVGINGPM